jgi:hypothetical protein
MKTSTKMVICNIFTVQKTNEQEKSDSISKSADYALIVYM